FVVVSEPLLPQFLLLVSSFMILSFMCLCAYALLAQRTKATHNSVSGKLLGKVFGSTFIGAGCLLATTSR
ncbi:MAG: LysE family translocator, partial [Pseudomonadales bacterium]|nr:LysE family translocator [Pseudomonadales bacterium]